MARPDRIPVNRFTRLGAESFVASIQAADLIYFVCNVGDGDAQLLVLPEETRADGPRVRRWVVVDAAVKNKIPSLIRATADGLLGPGFSFTEGTIPLVIASHPHLDHIGGLAEVVSDFGDAVSEFWDPGYYHTVGVYHSMMTAVEQRPRMLYAQPTSGLRRWIGNLAIGVLSPSIQLRNRFDTYGVEVNDSSISIKVEYPAARTQERGEGRNLVRRRSQSLILGADAQTLSWSYVLTDYPYLAGSPSDAAKAIGGATGRDPLRGHVLKVSHHGSKHGVNLELVERIRPELTLISSTPDGPSYRFPHTIAQELIREALQATTTSGRPRKSDHELGIFYTCDEDSARTELGTIAVVVHKGGGRTMWRFGDGPAQPVDLTKGRRLLRAP